jgi:hypothetical protein
MTQNNIFGNKLTKCGNLQTGYFRDGHCNTGPLDTGTHTICATMTDQFLNYTKSMGNDLITPNQTFNFPGLKHGQQWCICENRWKQAYLDGIDVKVDPHATNIKSIKTYNFIEGVN